MSVEHILTEIFNRPLFVTPDKLSVIMGVLEKKGNNPLNLDFSDLLPSIGSDANGGAVQAQARPVNASQEKQIAVVGALGSLTYRTAGNPNAGSGMRSYHHMQRDILNCLESKEIDGILMDFNTYGGSAQGCERMARFIREADSIKPIYGFVDMNCFSAGIYLVSACRKVILSDQDCGVGSIGCIAIHRDQSKRNKKDGDVYTTCSFGAEKNDFSPHVPLTDETKAKLQRSVDTFGTKFVQSVAEFRGVSEKQIRATEAGVFYGQDAIDAGLADAIAPLDEVLAMLADEVENENNKKFYGGTSMSMTTKERMAALLTAEDGQEALAALGYIKKEDAEASNKEAVDAAADAKLIVDKLQLCCVGGITAAQSLTIVEDTDLTLEQSGKAIQAIKANASNTTRVTSTINPAKDGEKHGLIAAAEQHAAAQRA